MQTSLDEESMGDRKAFRKHWYGLLANKIKNVTQLLITMYMFMHTFNPVICVACIV